MDKPKVKVIVLSYNRKEETLKCLKSIFDQTYENIDIIVLDNNSDDGSPEAIEKNFPQVEVMRMPANYGDWEGRDIAFANCFEKYTAIVDNDATLNEDVVERLVEAMEKKPKLAVVEPRVEDPDTGVPFSCSPSVAKVTHYRANFLGCTALFRTQALRKAGGFPHYLLGGAEIHLVFRFLDLGYRVLHLGDTVVYHDKSEKERIPHRRIFLQTKQKTKACAAHYPSNARALLDILWKSLVYVLVASREGYIAKVPKKALLLIKSGIIARKNSKWKVEPETINIMDYLNMNTVKSEREYKCINTGENLFLDIAKERLISQLKYFA